MAKTHAAASGFPDWSPAVQALSQHWQSTLRRVYAQHGFTFIDTPLGERTQNLVAKGGNAKEMYVLRRFHAEADDANSGIALRFDHTVPLALYTARYPHDIAFPFKRATLGPVFRGERPQKGRYRQFTQCDADIIGQGTLSVAADAEIIALAVRALSALNIGPFVVHLNHRKMLQGALLHFGVQPDDIQAAMHVLDAREKVSPEHTQQALLNLGLTTGQATDLLAFITGTISQAVTHPLYQEGKQEMDQIVDLLEAQGIDPAYYTLDPTIARGLDYYTGVVLEAKLTNHSLGTIAAGGRYADLTSMFASGAYPGVGMSIGLTRLLSAFAPQPPAASPVLDVLVVPYTKDQLVPAFTLAHTLRSDALRVSVYTEADKKMKKKFQYADKTNVPIVAILGEDEVEQGTVTLKYLHTGDQATLPLADARALLLQK